MVGCRVCCWGEEGGLGSARCEVAVRCKSGASVCRGHDSLRDMPREMVVVYLPTHVLPYLGRRDGTWQQYRRRRRGDAPLLTWLAVAEVDTYVGGVCCCLRVW